MVEIRVVEGAEVQKPSVVGVIERGGSVVARYIPKLRNKSLLGFIAMYLKLDESILMTDEFMGYNPLNGKVFKSVVNHEENYVDDDSVTNTNTIEEFWTGIKRVCYGTHHHYTKTCNTSMFEGLATSTMRDIMRMFSQDLK